MCWSWSELDGTVWFLICDLWKKCAVPAGVAAEKDEIVPGCTCSKREHRTNFLLRFLLRFLLLTLTPSLYTALLRNQPTPIQAWTSLELIIIQYNICIDVIVRAIRIMEQLSILVCFARYHFSLFKKAKLWVLTLPLVQRPSCKDALQIEQTLKTYQHNV